MAVEGPRVSIQHRHRPQWRSTAKAAVSFGVTSMTVYAIRAERTPYVKIGFTRRDHPYARLAEFQTANHCDLIVIAFWAHWGLAHERALHRHFSHRHERGEWFWFNEPDDRVPYDLGLAVDYEAGREGSWLTCA